MKSLSFRGASIVFWATTLIKVLMVPLYRSTDFEVHRNWLAITHSLPLSEWYHDTTSEWTLDYPPMFAYFEYLLSHFAQYVDPNMLKVDNLLYDSYATILFQRLTVIVTDLVLFASIIFFLTDRFHSQTSSHRATSFSPSIHPQSSSSLSSTVPSFSLDQKSFSSQEQTLRQRHRSKPSSASLSGKKRDFQSFIAPSTNVFNAYQKRVLLVFFTFANPGLLLVDHIHFQYNGVMLGLLIISLALINKGHDLAGAITFTILINCKHLFLTLAPAYFIFLLRHYCFQSVFPSFVGWEEYSRAERKAKTTKRFVLINFIKLAVCVLFICGLSFGPFLVGSKDGPVAELKQIFSRLFPFGRGLTHAYWAPNVWALYNAADFVLTKIYKIGTGIDLKQQALLSIAVPNSGISIDTLSTTSGLVKLTKHFVLPEITPRICALLTVLFLLGVLRKLWANAHPKMFVPSVIYCGITAFMLGWHVHEKAVLVFMLPLGLISLDTFFSVKAFYFLSCVGSTSLFPLLFTARELPVKAALVIIYLTALAHLLMQYVEFKSHTRKIGFGARTVSGNVLERVYLYGLIFVSIYSELVHPLVPFLANRLPFLPLMLMSVYCAYGMLYSWLLCYKIVTKTDTLLKSYDEDDDGDGCD